MSRASATARPSARLPLRFEQLEDRLALSPVVPAHSSLSGAPATLYLDFDGHTQASWGEYSPGTTPAFDRDGNPNSFSDSEKAVIKEVWQRVAEDYAPFNLNVTTVDPGDFSNGKAIRVVIGGSYTDWYHAAGGVSYRDSFTSALPNVAYVFSVDGVSTAKQIAEACSHEAGHTFGLRHQSLYAANGTKLDEYNSGNAAWAPIMGVGYYADRTTWHNGTTTSASTLQDDMAVLSNATNGFGYRPDDHSSLWLDATALSRFSGSSFVFGYGVVEKTTDADWFSFSTAGGQVSLSVAAAAVGANLDAKIALYKLSNGLPLLVTTADPAGDLGATITTTLAAGTYYLSVKSHGEYGDVGKYTVTGTVPPPIQIVNVPYLPNLPLGAATGGEAALVPSSASQVTQPGQAATPPWDAGAVQGHSGEADPGVVPLGVFVGPESPAASGIIVHFRGVRDPWQP